MNGLPLLRRAWPVLLWAAFNAGAQTVSPCPPTARAPDIGEATLAAPQQRDRGFLWRIRKEGRSSYLYGTVHVARLDWVVPGSKLVSALRASDVVALELDIGDEAIMNRLIAAMRPRPGQTLDADLAVRLRAQLQAACLPQGIMAAMSPEMIAATLSMLAGRRDGLDPAYAIDRSISVLAHRLRKTVVSLETPEQQLLALQSSDPNEARLRTGQALDGLESGGAATMLRRIADIWADSRFDELDRYEQWCECVETDRERAAMRRLIDDRNPGLAERIDAIHAGGQPVFAAVGSLHMIGPRGLPALMGQRGYAVERIRFD